MRKFKKSTLTLLLTLLGAALVLTGCAPKVDKPAETTVVMTEVAETTVAESKVEETSAETSAAAAQSGAEITVKDSQDREVTFAEAPKTVISMGPNMTELLYALGLEDRLVGNTTYCDYPEAAQKVEKIGTLMEPDFEKIAELKPALALCSTHISDETVAKLDELKIQALCLYDSENLEGLKGIITTVGKVFQVEDAAQKLNESVFSRIDAIRNKTKDMDKVSCYYVVGFGESGDYTAGGNTFINGILEAAGAENIAKDVEGWKYSVEQLVEKDPQVILVPNWAADTFGKEAPYDQLTAVKEGRVFPVDDNLFSRQGPRNADAVELVDQLIHPEK